MGVLSQEWLDELDNGMGAQKRNIILLLDLSSVHTAQDTNLNSMKVVLLPPNTTAKM